MIVPKDTARQISVTTGKALPRLSGEVPAIRPTKYGKNQIRARSTLPSGVNSPARIVE